MNSRLLKKWAIALALLSGPGVRAAEVTVFAAANAAKQSEAAKKFRQYLDPNDAAKVFEKFCFIIR